MTTDELRAIVDAAKARQADITPKPWYYNQWGSLCGGVDGETRVMQVNHLDEIEILNPTDEQAMISAPDLNAAVIALAEENEQLKIQLEKSRKRSRFWQSQARVGDTNVRVTYPWEVD